MSSFTADFWRKWASLNNIAPLAPFTEEVIASIEASLGNVRLPPSYRTFLLTVGTLPHSMAVHFEGLTLLEPQDLVWFREANEHWIRCYEEPMGDDVDKEHDGWKVSDLRGTLQVSTITDSVFLLNPNKVDESTGEWAAWLFANWVPGATVHASFGELLVASIEEAKRLAQSSQE